MLLMQAHALVLQATLYARPRVAAAIIATSACPQIMAHMSARRVRLLDLPRKAKAKAVVEAGTSEIHL
jgi:hypothetical protein